MSGKGHIQMGAPGALRPYVLADPKRRTRILANPMSVKAGTGAGSYDDQQNWAGWVMDSWMAGVGKKDTAAGGFLYAQADTRFPNRLLLPYIPVQHDQTDNNSYAYQAGLKHPNAEIAVGADSPYKWIAHKFTAHAKSGEALLYLKNEGVTVRTYLYTDSGGMPGVQAGLGFLNPQIVQDYNNIGYSLFRFGLGALTPGTTYHIVLVPQNASETMHVPTFAPGAAGVTNLWNGTTWANYNTSTTLWGIFSIGPTGQSALYNGTVYGISGNDIIKMQGTTWTVVSTRANPPTALQTIGDRLYIGYGAAQILDVMTTAEVFTADANSQKASLFTAWNGFIWAALGTDVYYSGGSTWTTVSVGDPGETITAMAGAGDYLYVATNNTLYYVGWGDQVRTVTPWPTLGVSPRMLTYQGALYVALGRSLIKYEGGSVLPMGLDLGEGLPALRDGWITAMATSNYWLFVAVAARDAKGTSTVWAWNGQGWHYISSLYNTPAASGQHSIDQLLYDRSQNTLYLRSSGSYMMTVTFPDVANYSTEVEPRYSPFGWLETDWFFGGLYEIPKDMESVYISSEVCDESNYIDVYFKDDDSTAWELLGRVTETRQELRWSDYATRPNTRQIKLGFALYSKQVGHSPIIRAIRLKYMTMVMDRWRWTLPIIVSDNQQMPNSDQTNQHNVYSQRQHLDQLIIRVPPFILEDVDGVRYEAKILAAADSVEKWDRTVDGDPAIQYVYTLTVEQATTGAYTGP